MTHSTIIIHSSSQKSDALTGELPTISVSATLIVPDHWSENAVNETVLKILKDCRKVCSNAGS